MSDDHSTDPLLSSLRRLGVEEAPPGAARVARAAFQEAFAPPHVRLARTLGRGLVPVGLAGIVGVYLTWAFGTALALMN